MSPCAACPQPSAALPCSSHLARNPLVLPAMLPIVHSLSEAICDSVVFAAPWASTHTGAIPCASPPLRRATFRAVAVTVGALCKVAAVVE